MEIKELCNEVVYSKTDKAYKQALKDVIELIDELGPKLRELSLGCFSGGCDDEYCTNSCCNGKN